MKLLGNKILVQVEEITEWRGIAIPMSITHDTNPFSEARVGKVLAIGVGRRNKKGKLIPITDIQVGDRVLLPNHSKTRVDFNDAFCWMIDADLILGKLEPDATGAH